MISRRKSNSTRSSQLKIFLSVFFFWKCLINNYAFWRRLILVKYLKNSICGNSQKHRWRKKMFKDRIMARVLILQKTNTPGCLFSYGTEFLCFNCITICISSCLFDQCRCTDWIIKRINSVLHFIFVVVADENQIYKDCLDKFHLAEDILRTAES